MIEVTQEDSDRLADILWWIKGYIAARPDEPTGLDSSHIEALRKFRVYFEESSPRIEQLEGSLASAESRAENAVAWLQQWARILPNGKKRKQAEWLLKRMAMKAAPAVPDESNFK